MDGYMVHSIEMARGSLMRIDDGKGALIHVREGELWITQEGDPLDYLVKPGGCYFVNPGGWFQIDRQGVALISALCRSVITITAPVPAPGGWLLGLRHRLARLWTNPYVRHSNPKTA
jgi:Protein of unknown function (DUF2917)